MKMDVEVCSPETRQFVRINKGYEEKLKVLQPELCDGAGVGAGAGVKNYLGFLDNFFFFFFRVNPFHRPWPASQ